MILDLFGYVFYISKVWIVTPTKGDGSGHILIAQTFSSELVVLQVGHRLVCLDLQRTNENRYQHITLIYPLVILTYSFEKNMFNRQIHYKRSCSIAMLNYQMVTRNDGTSTMVYQSLWAL